MDKRLCEPTVVNPMGKVNFRLGAKEYKGVIIADLEPDHCCLRMPRSLHDAFEVNPLLEDWHLTFPSLPHGEVKAKVVWVQDAALPATDLLEVGVQFLEVPEKFAKALAEYVACVKRESMAPEEFNDMPA